MDDGFMPGKRRLFILSAGILLAAAMFGLPACGGPNEGAPRSYGHDGYMGLSNSNPNMRGNPNYINYGGDTKFMEEKLMQLGGIEDVRFRVQDPHIYVSIRPDRGLSLQEAESLAAEAQSMLQLNMPRYTIHLEVDSGG